MFHFIQNFLAAAPIAPTPLAGAAQVIREIMGEHRTHLDIQKVLYIAQITHLGRHGLPVVPDEFLSTMFGPITLGLKSILKKRAMMQERIHRLALRPEAIDTLQQVAEECRDFTSGQLVAITHWQQGAWAAHYEPNWPGKDRQFRGRVIPHISMTIEYHDRQMAASKLF